MSVRAVGLPVLIAAIALSTAGCSAKRANSQAQRSSPVTDSQPETDPVTDSPTSTDPATDPATDSASPSSTETPTVAAPRTPVTKPVSRPPVNLQACAAPSLRAALQPASRGASHAGYVIVFTNGGQIACQLAGYPRVAILDGAGKQISQAARTPSGYLGGIRNGKPPFPVVVLNGGQSASALLEGLIFNPTTTKACPAAPALLTTPPASTLPIRVPGSIGICAQVQIHPVVEGSTGSR